MRAVEIVADAVFKGTRVDGIYDSDPEKNKDAVKYDAITYKDILNKGLRVMDLTAISLCQENNLPYILLDNEEIFKIVLNKINQL